MRHAARRGHWLRSFARMPVAKVKPAAPSRAEPERHEDATERDRAADAGKERR